MQFVQIGSTIQSPRTADFQAGSKRAFLWDFRRYRSALSVSGDPCGLLRPILASRLCIQKFRSPRQGFDGHAGRLPEIF